MGCTYMIGNAPVTAEELEEKVAIGLVDRFRANAVSNLNARLDFYRGFVVAAEVLPPSSDPTVPPPSAPDFVPIGIGKPISIEILTIYTGDAPSKAIFGGKPDLLVSSALKALHTFDAAPRAINQLVSKIQDCSYIEPSAVRKGAPVVYYSPSLVNATMLCTFELVAETFQKKIFEQMSGLFSSAAGIPIFAPANAYLLAGSFLTKIFADLGKALLESDPFLRADMNMRFDTPGFAEAMARRAFLYNDRDNEEFHSYKAIVKDTGSGIERAFLVHEDTGKEYRGKAPYIIVNIDGRNRQELKDFTAKLASAAIIERFYGSADTSGKVIETIGSAMELYNDFTFRRKAEELKKTIGLLDPNSDEYKKAKKLFNAYNNNIRNKDLFKVSLEGEGES